jgi:hypothetical protein
MLISSMTDEQLPTNANQIKEVIVDFLGKQGLLTKTAEEINQTYALVLHRRGFFGKVIDKLIGVEGDRLVITLVKVVG